MHKIIDGKTYNTATATFICDVSGPVTDRGNFNHDDTALYLTRKGQFFIAGTGGPLSIWAVSTGQSSWSGGEGMRLIDQDDARAMVERHASPDLYAQLFGDPVEG